MALFISENVQERFRTLKRKTFSKYYRKFQRRNFNGGEIHEFEFMGFTWVPSSDNRFNPEAYYAVYCNE